LPDLPTITSQWQKSWSVFASGKSFKQNPGKTQTITMSLTLMPVAQLIPKTCWGEKTNRFV
jgi:hypothetical protein